MQGPHSQILRLKGPHIAWPPDSAYEIPWPLPGFSSKCRPSDSWMINVDVEVQSRVGKPCMSWIFADLLDFMWENSLSTPTVGYKDCTEVEELTFFAKGSSSTQYICSGKTTQKSKFLQLFVPLPKSYWRATKIIWRATCGPRTVVCSFLISSVGDSWSYLVMGGYGWSRLVKVGHGWFWFGMPGHSWSKLVTAGRGWQ